MASISLPIMALLAGGAQGYGNTVARTRAQQAADEAEQRRQMLSLLADAAQRRQEEAFQQQQQQTGYQNDVNLENLRAGNEAAARRSDTLNSLLADPYNAFKDQPYSYDAGVLRNAGATPGQIQAAIGAEPMTPGTTTTTANPGAFTAGGSTSPLLPSRPGQGVYSLLKNSRQPTLGSNIYANPYAPGGPGAPLQAPTGPLTRTTTTPATPNPNGIAIPYTAADQAKVDYETGRTAALSDKNIQAYLRDVKLAPTDQQGQITDYYRQQFGLSLPMPGVDIPFYQPDVKTGAQIAGINAGVKEKGAQTAVAQARIPLLKVEQQAASARIPLIKSQVDHINALTTQINNRPTPLDPGVKQYLSSQLQRAAQYQKVIDQADTQKNIAMRSTTITPKARQDIIAAQNSRITQAGVALNSINRDIERIQSRLNATTTPIPSGGGGNQLPLTVTHDGKTYRLGTDGRYYLPQ